MFRWNTNSVKPKFINLENEKNSKKIPQLGGHFISRSIRREKKKRKKEKEKGNMLHIENGTVLLDSDL